MPFFYKRGAMFGLDARIALAIFGALSVISGAALYSAIQQAKTIAFVAELENYAKSFDSYRLDVGEEIPYDVNGSNFVLTTYIGELISSTKRGWKGPYLEFNNILSGGTALEYKGGEKIQAHFATNNPNRTAINNFSCSKASSYGCSLYVKIIYMDLETAEKVDLYVDGEINHLKGKVQISQGNAVLDRSSPISFYYYVSPAMW